MDDGAHIRINGKLLVMFDGGKDRSAVDTA
jgi:hypothetical protein